MRLAPLTVSGTLAVACWLLPDLAQAQLADNAHSGNSQGGPERDERTHVLPRRGLGRYRRNV